MSLTWLSLSSACTTALIGALWGLIAFAALLALWILTALFRDAWRLLHPPALPAPPVLLSRHTSTS